MPGKQRGAERAAGVAGRGLNPDVVERALAQQSAIGDAVQRHAAGQTRFFMPVSAMHLLANGQHGLLGDGLNARREIHVPLLDVRFRIARRPAEQIVESASSSWSGPGSS